MIICDSHLVLIICMCRTYKTASPVFERVGNQSVRRDRRNRLVPVLHRDSVELHIDDIAIRTELRHLNPIADANHVLGGELNTGH